MKDRQANVNENANAKADVHAINAIARANTIANDNVTPVRVSKSKPNNREHQLRCGKSAVEQ